MDRSIILNFILSFVLLLIGLMFLEGIWKKKGTVLRGGFDIDNLLFSNLIDKRLLRLGDQLAFLVCLLMSLLTLMNGIFFLFSDDIPNISAIFIFIAVVLSWPIRITFIYINKHRKYNEIPRIWPFRK